MLSKSPSNFLLHILNRHANPDNGSSLSIREYLIDKFPNYITSQTTQNNDELVQFQVIINRTCNRCNKHKMTVINCGSMNDQYCMQCINRFVYVANKQLIDC